MLAKHGASLSELAPHHVWADVEEEIDVDDDGDEGAVCALCYRKKDSRSDCKVCHL